LTYVGYEGGNIRPRTYTLAEREVQGEVYQFLLKKYGAEAVEDHRNKFGPDFIVTPKAEPRFLVDCKKSQPRTGAGNGVPDRAVGQMIRYYRRRGLPIYLIVPSDWKLGREQGEGSGDSWKTQVEDSLRFVKLYGTIKVVCLDNMREEIS